MSSKNRYMKHMLQWLIAGSRGGPNRAKLIVAIKNEPMNANQLGVVLGVDYRTIRHHLDILEKNGLVTSIGQRYGKMYFLSVDLEASYGDFEEIWKRIGKTSNNDGGL
ncbi:MAG: winged helix-turn-helix domain-containing protein [Candidatus Bathyarchaeota archaeon]|nr:winged helix-turn-helix domain-containing protein [Candidatus Bathyarchaeota archaeon]